jgi:hypothetical protein
MKDDHNLAFIAIATVRLLPAQVRRSRQRITKALKKNAGAADVNGTFLMSIQS